MNPYYHATSFFQDDLEGQYISAGIILSLHVLSCRRYHLVRDRNHRRCPSTPNANPPARSAAGFSLP